MHAHICECHLVCTYKLYVYMSCDHVRDRTELTVPFISCYNSIYAKTLLNLYFIVFPSPLFFTSVPSSHCCLLLCVWHMSLICIYPYFLSGVWCMCFNFFIGDIHLQIKLLQFLHSTLYLKIYEHIYLISDLNSAWYSITIHFYFSVMDTQVPQVPTTTIVK